jgi:hypothetical protein
MDSESEHECWLILLTNSDPPQFLSLERGEWSGMAHAHFFPTRKSAMIYRREFGVKEVARVVKYNPL